MEKSHLVKMPCFVEIHVLSRRNSMTHLMETFISLANFGILAICKISHVATHVHVFIIEVIIEWYHKKSEVIKAIKKVGDHNIPLEQKDFHGRKEFQSSQQKVYK